MWRRIVGVGAGVVLIVLGFVDFHVQTAAIVVGLVLIGAVNGEELARLFRAVGLGPRNGNGNGEPGR
jgi:hypothetical protein